MRCVNRRCDFAGRRHLPIVTVDEPIYERLPAFMIATADKFAALPWSGETAGFFRGGDAADPRPPDLIIQDELHLISGPLGTMAGLYETAVDHLCRRWIDGKEVRPENHRIDRDRAPRPEADSRFVWAILRGGVPGAGNRASGLVLCATGATNRCKSAALSRHRRAGTRTEGHLPEEHDSR